MFALIQPRQKNRHTQKMYMLMVQIIVVARFKKCWKIDRYVVRWSLVLYLQPFESLPQPTRQHKNDPVRFGSVRSTHFHCKYGVCTMNRSMYA